MATTKAQSAKDIAIEAAQSAAPKISDSDNAIKARLARIARLANQSEQESADLLSRTIKSLPLQTIKPSLPPGIRLGKSLKTQLTGMTLGELSAEKLASACRISALAGDGTAEIAISHHDDVRSSASSSLLDAIDSDRDQVAVSIARHFRAMMPSEDELIASEVIRTKALLDKARRGGR